MRNTRVIWSGPFIMLLILALACKHPEKINSTKTEEEKQQETLSNIVMPDGFSYDNYHQVETAVQFYDNFDRLLKHQVFEVYTEDNRQIMTATTNEFGRYAGRLTLPKVSSNIIIRASRIGLVNDEWTVPVTGTSLNVSIKY
jgi:hypothetical protein